MQVPRTALSKGGAAGAPAATQGAAAGLRDGRDTSEDTGATVAPSTGAVVPETPGVGEVHREGGAGAGAAPVEHQEEGAGAGTATAASTGHHVEATREIMNADSDQETGDAAAQGDAATRLVAVLRREVEHQEEGAGAGAATAASTGHHVEATREIESADSDQETGDGAAQGAAATRRVAVLGREVADILEGMAGHHDRLWNLEDGMDQHGNDIKALLAGRQAHRAHDKILQGTQATVDRVDAELTEHVELWRKEREFDKGFASRTAERLKALTTRVDSQLGPADGLGELLRDLRQWRDTLEETRDIDQAGTRADMRRLQADMDKMRAELGLLQHQQTTTRSRSRAPEGAATSESVSGARDSATVASATIDAILGRLARLEQVGSTVSSTRVPEPQGGEQTRTLAGSRSLEQQVLFDTVGVLRTRVTTLEQVVGGTEPRHAKGANAEGSTEASTATDDKDSTIVDDDDPVQDCESILGRMAHLEQVQSNGAVAAGPLGGEQNMTKAGSRALEQRVQGLEMALTQGGSGALEQRVQGLEMAVFTTGQDDAVERARLVEANIDQLLVYLQGTALRPDSEARQVITTEIADLREQLHRLQTQQAEPRASRLSVAMSAITNAVEEASRVAMSTINVAVEEAGSKHDAVEEAVIAIRNDIDKLRDNVVPGGGLRNELREAMTQVQTLTSTIADSAGALADFEARLDLLEDGPDGVSQLEARMTLAEGRAHHGAQSGAHETTLAQHANLLQDQAKLLQDQTKLLQDQTARSAEHGRCLQKHTEQLAQHDIRLEILRAAESQTRGQSRPPSPPAAPRATSVAFQDAEELDQPRDGSTEGLDAICNVVDHLTGLCHVIACKGTDTAQNTADRILQGVVRLHGLPHVVVSDRDAKFTSHFWQALHARLGTRLAMSSAYHPQTDGKVERANAVLEETLRCFTSARQDDWAEHLAAAELAINSSVSDVTGLSPFFAAYGFHPRLPWHVAHPKVVSDAAEVHVDALQSVHIFTRDALQRAKEKMRGQLDRRRRPVTHNVGDHVLLATKHLKVRSESYKLSARYIGPFEITEVLQNAVRLDLPPTLQIHPVVNVAAVRAYYQRPEHLQAEGETWNNTCIEIEGERRYLVEALLGRRGKGVKRKYLVKWQGWDTSQCTWEPVQELPAWAVTLYENRHPQHGGDEDTAAAPQDGAARGRGRGASTTDQARAGAGPGAPPAGKPKRGAQVPGDWATRATGSRGTRSQTRSGGAAGRLCVEMQDHGAHTTSGRAASETQAQHAYVWRLEGRQCKQSVCGVGTRAGRGSGTCMCLRDVAEAAATVYSDGGTHGDATDGGGSGSRDCRG